MVRSNRCISQRADRDFYTHAIVAVCRKMKVRFSITDRQNAQLRQLIEAIPESDWRPIPSMAGVYRRSLQPAAGERLLVRAR